ncbi:MAG: quinolinate synthase NadA [Candidatus Lokiarchaeota archaeon]|nr:quinolinate synthase NadA [Candidatus Lokiarchaeota archaeon]
MNEKNWKYIKKLPQKDQDLIDQIVELKKSRNVLLLAHNYQRESVQLIADILGDSLAMARSAQKEKDAKYILVCGVKFMAETASILNQDKKIIFPEKSSICSMAEYVDAEKIKKYKENNPNVPVILYINSTAESKTQADVVCTSSNAIIIAKAMKKEFNSDKIGFSPDKNLGRYVAEKTGIPTDIIPKEGNCYVHNQYNIEHLNRAKQKLPEGKLLAHPESPKEILDKAHFIGSTSQIIKYTKQHPEIKKIIIGTENGIVDLLSREYPDKTIIPLCEDAICKGMKQITLKSILNALKNLDAGEYRIKVDKWIADKSIDAINKMMELSKTIK